MSPGRVIAKAVLRLEKLIHAFAVLGTQKTGVIAESAECKGAESGMQCNASCTDPYQSPEPSSFELVCYASKTYSARQVKCIAKSVPCTNEAFSLPVEKQSSVQWKLSVERKWAQLVWGIKREDF